MYIYNDIKTARIIRTSYRTIFVGKHGDTFQRSSSCDLRSHETDTLRPVRGRIWKIPLFQDHKRLQSPVPRHIVGKDDYHQGFASKSST